MELQKMTFIRKESVQPIQLQDIVIWKQIEWIGPTI